MEPATDLLHPSHSPPLPLGRALRSPPTLPHSSLNKSAVVRADPVSLEKRITFHFNALLGLPHLGRSISISRWRDVPRILANVQQYIDGVPPVCIPIVDVDDNDRITNDICTWNEEQRSSMQYALNRLTIRACPRPIDRKVIFTYKVPDPSSGHLKLVDSTCGYSPMWLLQNMFTEQCYTSQTIDILRQHQVPQFEALLGHLNNQKTIPWRRLPLILWNAGMMVTGMPRLCAPRPLDKHRSDGLKGLWPRAWRVWLQRVLDSGVLRVEHCKPDRQIVIQILEEDYSLTDDDYGLAQPLLESPVVPAQTLEHVPIAELTPNTEVLVVNTPPSPTNPLLSSLPVRLKPSPIQSSASSNNESHSGSSRTSSHGSVVPTSGVKFVIPPARRKAHEKAEFADHLIHHPLPQSIGFYPTGLPYPTPPLITTPTGTPPPTIIPYPFPGYIHPALATHSYPTFPPGFIANVKKPKARMRTKAGAKPKPQIKGKGPVHRGRSTSSPPSRVASVLTPPYAGLNNVESEPLSPKHTYEADFEGGEPEPGTFGLRDSLSPQPPDIDLLLQYGMESLPRRAAEPIYGRVLDEDMGGAEPAKTRDDLPVPIPVHLPKPGGELYYHAEAQTWELSMGGAADSAAWSKALPVFPCRLIWNATRGMWRCVPCERWEMVTAEDRVRMERDKRIVRMRRGWQSEVVPFVMDGLALVWQRSRRKWTLEEYVEEEGEKMLLREIGLA